MPSSSEAEVVKCHKLLDYTEKGSATSLTSFDFLSLGLGKYVQHKKNACIKYNKNYQVYFSHEIFKF